jgi:hypothetical protein
MKLETRNLQDPLERAQFCARYTQASGTLLSPEQAEGCELIGVYSAGQLCGGYGLRVRSPFRAFNAIARPWNATPHEGRTLVEATALWTEPRLRSSAARLPHGRPPPARHHD